MVDRPKFHHGRDILPSDPQEVIEESPLNRYLVGMLAPFGTLVAAEEQEDQPGEDSGDDLAGAPELTPPLSQALSPSSIGLSCLVAPEASRLVGQVAWGDYERLPDSSDESDDPPDEAPGTSSPEAVEEPASSDDGGSDESPGDDGGRRRRPRERWQRIAGEPEPIDLHLRPDQGLQ